MNSARYPFSWSRALYGYIKESALGWFSLSGCTCSTISARILTCCASSLSPSSSCSDREQRRQPRVHDPLRLGGKQSHREGKLSRVEPQSKREPAIESGPIRHGPLVVKGQQLREVRHPMSCGTEHVVDNRHLTATRIVGWLRRGAWTFEIAWSNPGTKLAVRPRSYEHVARSRPLLPSNDQTKAL